WGEAGAPLLTAVVVASFGVNRVAKIAPAGEELKVALVQPAFAQTMIWNKEEDEARLNQMMALSGQALSGQALSGQALSGQALSGPANLLIWPEGALSNLTPEHLASLAALTARHGIWLVATADLSEISAGGATEYFNSSILISPRGEVESVYHKRRLVIFGEYVPWWLGFLKWVTPIDGAFTQGKEPVQF